MYPEGYRGFKSLSLRKKKKMEDREKTALKKIISVLIGLITVVLSFFVCVELIFFSGQIIFFALLCIFDISIIVFLILWNKNTSKTVYVILSIPVICIAVWIAALEYHDRIQKIPTFSEQTIYLDIYEPFMEGALLAKLDEESRFTIIENLPVLDGATALYPVYASFVQAVYPKGSYDMYKGPVWCSRTYGAYENLLEGKADIIFCAEPSEAQLERFNDSGIQLTFVPIGREAFVFFVNTENPVNGLSIEDIQGIYSGRIRNWKKLNGVYQGIRAFQRPENSGSQTMLEKVMGDIPIIKARRENVPTGMGDIINRVAVYRNFSNAIGYSFLFFSTEMVKNDQIKLLSINGIYPSKETIQDDTYPFSENFYAIYIDNDDKNEHIEPFIEWILSAQGQELVHKTGYIPL